VLELSCGAVFLLLFSFLFLSVSELKSFGLDV
jgi:hypothetical protein